MHTLRILFLSLCFVLAASAARAADHLDIYFVDVEGGQATLIVTPSGDSMLVDTGWPGFDGRDAGRIAAAAKAAGVDRINTLLITHFHRDHVGGVPQLAERMPIGAFIDHGASVETTQEAKDLQAAYLEVARKGRRRIIGPGAEIPLQGAEVRVLTANGRHIAGPALPGAGKPNPYCAGVKPKEADPTDNAQSIGILLTYGKFRFVDLGDLTWNKEMDLVCPNNRIGTVDVYLTTHHGLDQSGNPAVVHAVHSRVAIMNNGARKGGNPEAWQIVKSSPGLEDLWQLHTSIEGGKDHNVGEKFIANLEEKCEGKYLKISAQPDGGFTVTNSRNGYSKTYPAKK